MNIEPIGFLRSCYGGKFATPRQPGLSSAAWAVLEFSEEFRSSEAVRGLEGFSHVWLIFGFHLNEGKGWHPTVRPPRLGGNQRVGVFASRSTYRPNGLGLSLVRLDRLDSEGDGTLKPPLIHLSGADLVDGTPVYDIKPYLPYAESIPDAIAGYASGDIRRCEVNVEEGARCAFEKLDQRDQRVILEALSLDPRPAASPKDPEKSYGAELCGYNVRFRFEGVTCWIVSIGEIKAR